MSDLVCPRDGCRRVIRAMTGLQELDKLVKHYARVHGINITFADALELRGINEVRTDDPSPPSRGDAGGKE